MTAQQSIIALICPLCGADLTGLDTDAVFGCSHCERAYEPGPEGLGQGFPLRESDHEPGGEVLGLPFWALRLEPLLLPEEALAPELVYVPGFDLRRRGYFGDPGAKWTSERTRLSERLPRQPLLGMTVSLRDARRLARYFVLGAVDRQHDVTGFDLDIETSEPVVLIVSFSDEGDALVDPVTGIRYAPPAFCDLPALRRGARAAPNAAAGAGSGRNGSAGRR